MIRIAARLPLLTILATGLVAGVAFAPGDAAAVSKTVERKCRGDYKRLCPAYKTASDALRACMRSQHRAISNSCMNALVDAGEAPSNARRR